MYLSAILSLPTASVLLFLFSISNTEISLRDLAPINKFITVLAISLLGVSCVNPKTQDAVSFADPFVGTGFHGHTYPGATAPFGMVQLSPDTRNKTWDGSSGYHSSDSTILGFSHTHLSGTGCADLGDFLFLPFVGKDIPECLPFSHDDEMASPGYYKVAFPDAGVTAELTATTRTGAHRYSFSGEGERHILVDGAYNIGEVRPDGIFLQPEGNTVLLGGRHVNGWAPDRHIFFYARFSEPFSSANPLDGDRILLTFPESVSQVSVFVGLSQVDAAGAKGNLDAEVGGKDSP